MQLLSFVFSTSLLLPYFVTDERKTFDVDERTIRRMDVTEMRFLRADEGYRMSGRMCN